MTDRHAGYIVALETNVREDDAKHILNAIRMIKGVVDVKPVVADINLMIAEAKVNADWSDELLALLRNRGKL